MQQQSLVNLLGYVILLGILGIILFASSTLLVSVYILFLFAVGCFRIHLWKQIPKAERHVYSYWRTAILLHPIAQMGIIVFYAVANVAAILQAIGRP